MRGLTGLNGAPFRSVKLGAALLWRTRKVPPGDVPNGSRLAQAVFRRRRHQPRRPPPAKIKPGNPAPTMGPGTGTPGMKESVAGSKENVAAVTVVAAVIPEKASVKLAGPTTKGLNIPLVIEALAFVKLPPEGRII